MLTTDNLRTGNGSCLVREGESDAANRDQSQAKPSRQCSLGTIKLKKDFLELEEEHGNLTKVCLPIKADAYIRGDTEPKVLVLLKFKDDRGAWQELQVPKAECRDAKTLIIKLMNSGWDYFGPEKTVLAVLKELLTWCSPQKNLMRVEKPGWHRNGESGKKVFIYGNQILAPKGEKPAVYFYGTAPFKKQGTLEEWKQFVAKFFAGNSRQLLLLSAAFAGPLLGLVKQPNIGILLHGASRSGKTATLAAICSVFGDEEIMGC